MMEKTLPLAADVRDIAVFGNTYQFIAGGTGAMSKKLIPVSLEEGLTGAGFYPR